MSKIEKLTSEQELYFPIFRDEWLKIGRSTEPMDTKNASIGVKSFYKWCGKKEPEIIFCGSPFSAWIIYNLHDLQMANLIDNLMANLGDNLIDNLVDNKKYESTDFWGQWDSSWIAYYLFGNYIGVKYDKDKLDQLNNFALIAKSCGWFYTFKNAAIICDRPKIIRLNSIGQLHCDGGFAMEFRDGYGFCSLNGVRVPEYVAFTPREKFDTKTFLTEKNVEVKREIIRKIGNEKLCRDLNAETVEKNDMYELLILDIGTKKQPYLKMRNPSIGVFHIECVAPECDTIEKALNWRNGTTEKPLFLT